MTVPTTRDQLPAWLMATGRAGRWVELGVASGAYSLTMATAKPGEQYAVDRWACDRGHGLEEYKRAVDTLAPHGVRVLRMAFSDAIKLFPDGHFDFVYIDGYAHTGQLGGETIRAWWSKVAPGGVFAGHDYHPRWQPTVDAVDAFVGSLGCRESMWLTTSDEFPSWVLPKP